MGRKKNPTTVKLERELAKKDAEIAALKAALPESSTSVEDIIVTPTARSMSKPSGELTETSFIGVINNRTSCTLYPVKFSLETGEARIDLENGTEHPGVQNLYHAISTKLVKGELTVRRKKEGT